MNDKQLKPDIDDLNPHSSDIKMRRFCFVIILFSLLAGCEQKIFKDTETDSAIEVEKKNETLTIVSDPEKGKVVYYANCISCHNYNPKKPGSIGPQIYKSSKELLSNKINFGKYPKNYKPIMSTNIMPLLPHLDKEISNLHAFLNAP